ncbi:hypothetical protein QR680_009402 [Steinernema hermaphroditum]|uniref:Uncharacterized protein n=1 Tax=Steinernema hermaphroditum TaxID=289476 RepID=A0AA39IMJ4_9BILA|nr:hypothetical protein QR680_009402 [Steinernema hermaphroditum]
MASNIRSPREAVALRPPYQGHTSAGVTGGYRELLVSPKHAPSVTDSAGDFFRVVSHESYFLSEADRRFIGQRRQRTGVLGILLQVLL